MTSITIVIPFAHAPQSVSPNVRDYGGVDAVSTYLISAAVSLASFRRWNQHARLVFLSNQRPAEWFCDFLGQIDAEFVLREFTFQPPSGFTERFAGSLYFLDALDANELHDEVVVISDPDVLCVGNLGVAIEACDASLGVLPISYPMDRVVNGLSLRRAGLIWRDLGDDSSVPPSHIGGELVAIPGSLRPELRDRMVAAWRNSIDRFSRGEEYFKTEEHMLSFAARSMATCSLHAYARRIWTAHRHRTIAGDEGDLLMWHLPAEKDRGFADLWPEVQKKGSWFWKGDREEFVQRSARAMGISNRHPTRWAKDTVGQLLSLLMLPAKSKLR